MNGEQLFAVEHELADTIVEHGYYMDQIIFNIDEIGLNYKMLPGKTGCESW